MNVARRWSASSWAQVYRCRAVSLVRRRRRVVYLIEFLPSSDNKTSNNEGIYLLAENIIDASSHIISPERICQWSWWLMEPSSVVFISRRHIYLRLQVLILVCTYMLALSDNHDTWCTCILANEKILILCNSIKLTSSRKQKWRSLVIRMFIKYLYMHLMNKNGISWRVFFFIYATININGYYKYFFLFNLIYNKSYESNLIIQTWFFSRPTSTHNSV